MPTAKPRKSDKAPNQEKVKKAADTPISEDGLTLQKGLGALLKVPHEAVEKEIARRKKARSK